MSYSAASEAKINLRFESNTDGIEKTKKSWQGLTSTLKDTSNFEAAKDSIESTISSVDNLGNSFSNTANVLSNTPLSIESRLTGVTDKFSLLEDVAGNKIAKKVFPDLIEQLSSFTAKGEPVYKLVADLSEETTNFDKALVLISKSSKTLVAGIDKLQIGVTSLETAFKALGIQSVFVNESFAKIQQILGVSENLIKFTDVAYKTREALEDVGEAASVFGSALSPIPSIVGFTVKSTVDMDRPLQDLTSGFGGVEAAANLFGKSSVAAFAKFGFQATVIANIGINLGKVGDAVDVLTKQWSELYRGFETMQTLGIDSTFAELSLSVGAAGEKILFNVQATKQLISTATQAYAQLEESTKYVQTLSAGARYSTEELTESLQGLANKGVGNAIKSGELAISVYNNLSAGIGTGVGKIGDALEVSKTAAKYAASTNESVDTIQKALNFTSQAYGRSASESTKTMELLNKVVENGVTNAGELAANIGSLASTSASTGNSIESAFAATSIATKTLGSDAYIAIQRLYSSLSAMAPESKKALDELGFTLNAEVLKTKDLTTVMQELYNKAGGNVETLQKIIPESIAFRGALSLMTTSVSDAQTVIGDFGNVTGNAVDEMFDRSQESITKRSQALSNGFQEVFASAGQSIVKSGFFDAGLAAIEKLLNYFQNMPEPIKAVIGAIVAFNMGLEKVIQIAGTLLGIFATLATIAGTILTFYRGGAFFSGLVKGFKSAGDGANIFTKGLSAIQGGLKEAIGLSVKVSDTGITPRFDPNNVFVKSVTKAKDTLFNFFKEADVTKVNNFGKAFDNIKNAFKFNADKSSFSFIKDALRDTTKGIGDIAGRSNVVMGKALENAKYQATLGTKYYSALNPELSKYIGLNLKQLPVMQSVSSAFDKFKGAIGSVTNSTKNLIGNMSNFKSLDLIKNSFNGISESVSKNLKGISSNIKQVFNTDLKSINFKEVFSNLKFDPKTLINSFKQIPQQLQNNLKGIQDFGKEFTKALSGDMKSIVPRIDLNKFKESAITSTSNVLTAVQNKFKDLKLPQFNSVFEGLQKNLFKIQNIDFSNLKSIVPKVDINKFKNNIALAATNALTIMQTKLSGLKIDKLDGLFDGLKTSLNKVISTDLDQLPLKLSKGFKTFTDNTSKSFNSLSNKAVELKTKLLDSLNIKTDSNSFTKKLKDGFNDLVTNSKNTFNSISKNLDGLKQKITNSSLFSGLSKELDLLPNTINNKFSKVSSGLDNSFKNINLSPLTNSFKIVSANLDIAKESSAAFGKSLMDSFAKSKVGGTVIPVLSGVMKGLSGTFAMVGGAAKMMWTSVLAPILPLVALVGILGVIRDFIPAFGSVTEASQKFTKSTYEIGKASKSSGKEMDDLIKKNKEMKGEVSGQLDSFSAKAVDMIANVINGIQKAVSFILNALSFGLLAPLTKMLDSAGDGFTKSLKGVANEVEANFDAEAVTRMNEEIDNTSVYVAKLKKEIKGFNQGNVLPVDVLKQETKKAKEYYLEFANEAEKTISGLGDSDKDEALKKRIEAQVQVTKESYEKIAKLTQENEIIINKAVIEKRTLTAEEIQKLNEGETAAFASKKETIGQEIKLLNERYEEAKKIDAGAAEGYKKQIDALNAQSSELEKTQKALQERRKILNDFTNEINKNITDIATVGKGATKEFDAMTKSLDENAKTATGARKQALTDTSDQVKGFGKNIKDIEDYANKIKTSQGNITNFQTQTLNSLVSTTKAVGLQLDDVLNDAFNPAEFQTRISSWLESSQTAMEEFQDPTLVKDTIKRIEETQVTFIDATGQTIKTTLEKTLTKDQLRDFINLKLSVIDKELELKSAKWEEAKQSIADSLDFGKIDSTTAMESTNKLNKDIRDMQVSSGEEKLTLIKKEFGTESKEYKDQFKALKAQQVQFSKDVIKEQADLLQARYDKQLKAFNKERALAEKSTIKGSNDKDLENVDKLAEKEINLKIDNLNKELELNKDNAARKLEIEQQLLEATTDLEKTKFENTSKLLDRKYEKQVSSLGKEKALANKATSDGSTNAELDKIDELNTKEIELDISKLQEKAKLYKEGSNERLNIEKELASKVDALDEDRITKGKNKRKRELDDKVSQIELENVALDKAVVMGTKSREEVEDNQNSNAKKQSLERQSYLQEELKNLQVGSKEYVETLKQLGTEQVNYQKTIINQQVTELNRSLEEQKNSIQANISELNKYTNNYDLLIKSLEIERGIRESNNSFIKENSNLDIQANELRLKTTGDIVEKAQIQYQIVQQQNILKAQELDIELENLDTQGEINKANREKEKITQRINKLELERNILTTQNQIEIAKLNNESSNAVTALELQLDSLNQQNTMLDANVSLTDKQREADDKNIENQKHLLTRRKELNKESSNIDDALALQQIEIANYDKQLQQLNVKNRLIENQTVSQTALNDRITKAYERQANLLTQQKGSLDSLKTNTEAQLQLAMQGAKTEKQKEALQQQYNSVRLLVLDKQQKSDLLLLDIQTKQNNLALKRQEIENNIAKTRQTAAILEAQIEEKKVLARKDATDEEKQLAALNVDSAKQSLAALEEQSGFLQEQKKDQEVINKMTRDNKVRDQETAMLQERGNIAASTKSTFDDQAVSNDAYNSFAKNLNQLATTANNITTKLEEPKFEKQKVTEIKLGTKDVKIPQITVKQDKIENIDKAKEKAASPKIEIVVNAKAEFTGSLDKSVIPDLKNAWNEQANTIAVEIQRRLPKK